MDGERKVKSKACAVSILGNPTERDIEDCMIPDFCQSEQFDIPTCQMPSFHSLYDTRCYVSSLSLINGSPARVPPRRIPAHFRDEVEQQIQQILELGITVVPGWLQLSLCQKSLEKYGCVLITGNLTNDRSRMLIPYPSLMKCRIVCQHYFQPLIYTVAINL